MPSYFVFSQNMRTFGGGAALRNRLYANRLALTGNAVRYAAADVVYVAGYTEITNAGQACRNTVAALSARLDPDLDRTRFFWVGRSALAVDEWIALSWASHTIAVDQLGLVVRGTDHQWHLVNRTQGDPAVRIANVNVGGQQVPVSADFRGVAYVAGTLNGARVAVGFIHNVYTLAEKTLAAQNMPVIIALIDAAANAGGNVFVGGDFNVWPRNRPGHPPAIAGYPADYQHGVLLRLPTTRVSCYDYFMSPVDIAPTAAGSRVRRFDFTFQAGCSDHRSVALE